MEIPVLPATAVGYLQMNADHGERRMVGWTGPWPPPERMVLVIGQFDFTWTQESEVSLATLVVASQRPGWRVLNVERVSASKLTDEDMKTMTHVVRGAEYREAGDWAPTTERN